jgi:hypothetical protein
MKTYIISIGVVRKYPNEFGVIPEEWKDSPDDEEWVVFREMTLPPEIAREVREVESCIVDEQTGLRYELTMTDFDDIRKNQG